MLEEDVNDTGMIYHNGLYAIGSIASAVISSVIGDAHEVLATIAAGIGCALGLIGLFRELRNARKGK